MTVPHVTHDSANPVSPPTIEPELHPGWQPVAHEGLPAPTFWPAVLAFGVTLMIWGILTSWIISGTGLIVFVVAIAGWIGDLLHEH